jgi:uncharacterized repeat protein (TIGR01451 family)
MLGCLTGRTVRHGLRWSAAGAMAVGLSLGGLGYGSAAAAVGRDLGDAPASYDAGTRGAASAVVVGPRLGARVSADVVESGDRRRSGSLTADASDDAVSRFAPWVARRKATQSIVAAVSHVDAPALLCGWLDFDLSKAFDRAERSCTSVPAGAHRVRLAWTGRPVAVGHSVARLRIGQDRQQTEQPTGASDSGEVEDYPVRFVAAAAEPAITLTKTVSPTTASMAGEVLTYRLVAKNTGDVPLSTVRMSDALHGLSALACDAPDSITLLPGRSLTCTATRAVTQDDLDFGEIANIAEVSAEAPGGDPNDDTDDVTAIDDANVIAVQRPALALKAGWGVTRTRRGKRISLTLAARNTGNVTITRTKVSSSLKKLKLSCTPKQGTSLAPGASLTCSGRYTVSKADATRGKLKATGTVRGERPYGDPSRSADDLVVTASRTVKVAKSHSASASLGGSGSEPAGGGLASTGGMSPWWFGIGAGLVGAGAAAIRRGRRRT